MPTGEATPTTEAPPRIARRRRRPLATQLGLIVVAAWVIVGAIAPWLAPYDPDKQVDVRMSRMRPPMTVLAEVHLADGGRWFAERIERTPDGLLVERLGERHALPAASVTNLTDDGVADRRFYLLGSDKFGRDVFSRGLHGARVSLLIGGIALTLALSIGVLVGALAALGGGWIDGLLMRLVDGLLSFPWIFLLIALAAIYPTDRYTLAVILGCTGWMGISRLARAEILGVKTRGYVEAARGLGAGPVDIFFRHILPNAMTPLLVAATLMVGNLILVEASLSFLGLGIQAPQATWGNMIADGRTALLNAWWVATFPGLALVATVLAINLLGDALRDLLDPRHRTSARHG